MTMMVPRYDSAGYAMWTYWMRERMKVFLRRMSDDQPYSEDPKFQNQRFTNVYRPLDRVSQDMLRKITYGPDLGPREKAWRTLVYKHFNRPETFAAIEAEVGMLTTSVPWAAISGAVDKYAAGGGTVYTGAFMVHPADGHYDVPKHQAFMKYWHRYYVEEGQLDHLLAAESLQDAYGIARRAPFSGPFNGMQNVTDINYSLGIWDEDEWVMAGPGAERGLNVVAPGIARKDHLDALRNLHRRAPEELGHLGTLFDRGPSLMDIQNTMCELSKYAKGRSRSRYRPDVRGPVTDYVFPVSWGPNVTMRFQNCEDHS